MGAINYGSTGIINLGVSLEMLENHKDYLIEEYGEEWGLDVYDDFTREIYHTAENVLDTLSTYYYSVSLECGYYDGCYIVVDSEFDSYNSYEDKQEAQKELTQIKEVLQKLVNDCYFVEYAAGWCTAYSTQKESLQVISEMVKKEREAIKARKTWRNR